MKVHPPGGSIGACLAPSLQSYFLEVNPTLSARVGGGRGRGACDGIDFYVWHLERGRCTFGRRGACLAPSLQSSFPEAIPASNPPASLVSPLNCRRKDQKKVDKLTAQIPYHEGRGNKEEVAKIKEQVEAIWEKTREAAYA